MAEHDGGSFMVSGLRLNAPPLASGLYVVATPIGHLADITLRALQTLAAADAILAEDTRHTKKLLAHYGIRRPLLSYHEHNAERMRPQVLARLKQGAALALVSDAGTPLVSDPGVRLVREVIAAGLPLHVVPGPSAVIAALAVSGLASERFLFAGFVPAKKGARRRFLEELRAEPATLVLFESPHRIADSLQDMADIFGAREAALCRELTKLHEEVMRAPLPDLARQVAAREALRGEITLVIAPPAQEETAPDEAELREALRNALRDASPSRAAADIARRFGLKKRKVYELALKLQDEG